MCARRRTYEWLVGHRYMQTSSQDKSIVHSVNQLSRRRNLLAVTCTSLAVIILFDRLELRVTVRVSFCGYD